MSEAVPEAEISCQYNSPVVVMTEKPYCGKIVS